jgi:hypothetical protein
MSRHKPFDFERIRRYPISDRPSKVGVADLGRPLRSDSFIDFFDSLPRVLAGKSLRLLVERIQQARHLGKPIIWGFGGHVVKVGLGPILVDLMEEGYVTALATNGSGIIHDFELALWGGTSEDVDRELGSGQFGMAEETGRWLNEAINQGVAEGKGLGESVASYLAEKALLCSEGSLLWNADRLGLPITSHIGIGTDIIHAHPEASGSALGEASMIDFKIFTHQVSQLNGGGVYLNVGSAVVLPEVFLKAVSAVRSSGLELEEFTTANLDFLQHYRPQQNVVRRPVLASGTGLSLTGHHELMIPLLAAALRWGRQ